MDDLNLLDKAKNITGSDGKTAIKLGISKMRLSDIRNGRKSLSAAQAGVLAEITGGRWQEEAFRRLEALEATEEARSFWASKRLEMSSNLRRQSASRLSNNAADNVVAITSSRKNKKQSELSKGTKDLHLSDMMNLATIQPYE